MGMNDRQRKAYFAQMKNNMTFSPSDKLKQKLASDSFELQNSKRTTWSNSVSNPKLSNRLKHGTVIKDLSNPNKGKYVVMYVENDKHHVKHFPDKKSAQSFQKSTQSHYDKFDSHLRLPSVDISDAKS